LLILPSPQQQQISRLLCRRRSNSNKGTKILTGFFRIFYARRTFGNSAAPKIGVRSLGAALGDSSFAGSQQGMAANVGASLGFHGCEGPQPSRSGTTMKSFDLDLESICSRVKKDRKKWDGSEAIHP
jgi:hypothetical protein